MDCVMLVALNEQLIEPIEINMDIIANPNEDIQQKLGVTMTELEAKLTIIPGPMG